MAERLLESPHDAASGLLTQLEEEVVSDKPDLDDGNGADSSEDDSDPGQKEGFSGAGSVGSEPLRCSK